MISYLVRRLGPINGRMGPGDVPGLTDDGGIGHT